MKQPMNASKHLTPKPSTLQSYPNYSRDRYVARPRTYGTTLRYDL